MTQIPVRVYTTPNCVQCETTKRQMDKLNIKYEVIDLSQNIDELERLKGVGLSSAPIVETDNRRWSGYRHDKILSLANFIHSQEARDNGTTR